MTPPICPACSAQNRENAKFCRLCGTCLPQQNVLTETNKTKSESHTLMNDVSVEIETKKEVSKIEEIDFVGLEEIRSRLQMFINAQIIKQKQKKIGMSVSENTNILVFKGETGTGKSLVAEYFISQLIKSNCLFSNAVFRTTAHKLQRQ